MTLKKTLTGLLFTTVIVMAIGAVNVMASDDWKSKYRDVQQVQGTEYFLIHLYDVEIAGTGTTWYAVGVADQDGNIVLPVEYASIDTENVSDGRRLVSTFGKSGFVDESFKIVIEPVYDQAWPFKNGTARVLNKNPDGTSRVFYIDVNGNEVPDPTPEAERDFDYYWLHAGLELNISIGRQIGESDCAVFHTYSDGVLKDGIINVKTREVFSPLKWDNIVSNKAGEIWAQIKNTAGSFDTYVIDPDGSEEFKFQSERITVVWETDLLSFFVYESIKYKADAYSTALVDGIIMKSGLMDKSGNVIVAPTWETPSPYSWSDDNPAGRDGYLFGMSGSKNYEYMKTIGTIGDGKWGCVTTTGEVIIAPIYDNLQYMGYGRFYGSTAKSYSILDARGKTLPKHPYSFSLTATIPSVWATDAVAEAFQLGLVETGSNMNFNPHTYQWNITRQQFCELAVNLFVKVKGADSLPRITNKDVFTDTGNESVLVAYELGVIAGKGNGIFDPFAEITRQEAATMLTNLATALDISPTAEPLVFDDETDFADWAKDSIFAVTAIQNDGQRVMSGMGNNRFAPLNPYTVEQAIITVLHLYQSCPER